MSDRLSPMTPTQSDAGIVHADGVATVALLTALRRRWKLVTAATLLVVAAAAAVLLLEAPTYRASVVLRVIDTRQAVTAAIELPQANPTADRRFDPVFSQLHLLQSRAVLSRVVEEEGLRLVAASPAPLPELRHIDVAADATADSIRLAFLADSVVARTHAGAARAAYGAPLVVEGVGFTIEARPATAVGVLTVLPHEQAVDRVAARLRARSRAQTEIIDLSYTAATPLEAQRVVNAVTRVFQALDATRAQSQARRQGVFLASQVATIDSMLAQSQRELSEFRTREELFSSRDKLIAQQSALFQLDLRAGELNAEAQQLRSLVTRLQSSTGAARRDAVRTAVSAPAIAVNPVVMQLHAQLARYEASRDSLTGGDYGRAASDGEVVRLTEMMAATERQIVQALDGHIAALDARIAGLESLRQRNMSALQALPPKEANEVRLVQQVESTQRMSEQLNEQLQRARMAEALEGGQVEVVEWAALPYAPVPSWLGLKLAIAALLGLLIGGLLAAVLELRHLPVRGRSELELLLGMPTLATIPRLNELTRAGRRRPKRLGSTVQRVGTLPDLGRAEPYRALGVSLRYAGAGSLKTLVVTSALPGEGKSTTSTHLALSAARSGHRILLIDCDLHRPSLHHAFGVPAVPGLVQMLTGHGGVDAVRATSVEGLSVLPSGVAGGAVSELALNGNMSRLLERLAPHFDWIILDTPPLLAIADTASLAALADGVVLVVRAGSTERTILEEARQQLDLVGARVVGTVLNDPDHELPGYTRSRYRYYATSGAST
jgi:polysaccharide biosynthesis transport protein